MNDDHLKEYEYDIARARDYAKFLKQKLASCHSTEMIRHIESELVRLFKASHPRFYNIGLSRADCETETFRCPANDAAYSLHNVASRDPPMTVLRNIATTDATPPDETDPVATRIIAALRDLVVRCDELDKVFAAKGATTFRQPTLGPAEPLAPRELSPAESYQSAMNV
jgi:hypothetical protein